MKVGVKDILVEILYTVSTFTKSKVDCTYSSVWTCTTKGKGVILLE